MVIEENNMNMVNEFDIICSYCKAAMRAKSLGLCKLLIKEEIQPRIEELGNKYESEIELEIRPEDRFS